MDRPCSRSSEARPGCLAAVVLAVACMSSPARADLITTFTDRTTFTNTVGAVTVETFGTTPYVSVSTGVLNSTTSIASIGLPAGTVQAGVTYSTPVSSTNPYFFNIDSGGPPGFTGGFLDRLGDAPSQATGLTATFTGAVQAFGFDASNFMGSTLNMLIRFANGTSQTSTYNIPAATTTTSGGTGGPGGGPGSGPGGTGGGTTTTTVNPFFGFRSSAQDIVSATLWGTGEPTIVFAIDNFTFTTPATAAVPEPSSMALCASAGIIGLVVARAHRRRVA